MVVSNRGFAFHGGELHESDHGGYSRDEVRESFFVSGLGEAAPSRFTSVDGPALNRDVTPTVLTMRV